MPLGGGGDSAVTRVADGGVVDGELADEAGLVDGGGESSGGGGGGAGGRGEDGGGGSSGGGGGPGTGLNMTPVECLVLPPLFRTAKVQMFSPPPFCDKAACVHKTLL